MPLVKAFLIVSLAIIAIPTLCEAQTCLSGPTLVEDNSYMTFEVKNDCAGAAVIHYELRHPDGRQEADNWHVGKCATARFQYFRGEYKFTVDVDNSKTCAGTNAQRPENDKPPSPPKTGTTAIPGNTQPPDYLPNIRMTRAQAAERLERMTNSCKTDYACSVNDAFNGQNNACVLLKRDCFKSCVEFPTMFGYPADLIQQYCHE
jgi:hypothetical protein